MTKAGAKPKSEGELLRFVEDLKRQWMSTIDALQDPLMIVGKDYVVRKANVAAARMENMNVKEIVGRKCHEVFAGRKTPCNGCKMLVATTQSETTTFELANVRGDRFYEVSSFPLQDSDGKFDGIVQVYRDRTEANRLREQLAQQEKLASIGLLAGGVAHEINNPLGGILIFSQMLLREMPKESPHREDVVEIEAATQRCKAIVESLLDFARANPSGSKKKREDVNVLDAIRTALRFGKVSQKAGGHVEIEEFFDEDMHPVAGDRNRLVQLFLNLIQNALQAMPDGGTLSIRSQRKQVDGPTGRQEVGVYVVEDTGIGIAPEHMKKVFDPFFTTKEPGEGTGLGLALCFSIVQDLRGKMTVESTVNVGTRFMIELPLTSGEATVGNITAAKPA